ncbi:hypothetical protein FJZ53_02185 [Candidatus Woesearchaeota archaeon]|nr:hypothetical protein [Candidatus Woesearchaeota archaeon]
MKLPKTFMPEKDLEEKINGLSKECYEPRLKNLQEKPTLEDLQERTKPVFESVTETIYGKDFENTIGIDSVPDCYAGFLDFILKGYESVRYYCALFDLNSEKGCEWRDKFLNDYKGEGLYEFKPDSTFNIKGRLIKEGITNDFWWYIIKLGS